MAWLVYFAHFFGGAFLANALPHLIAGISGHPLQSPFASPPFRGLSSPTVNVAWAPPPGRSSAVGGFRHSRP